MEGEKIAERTCDEYVSVCDAIANTFGRNLPAESLTFDDFDRLTTIFRTNKKGKRVSPLTHKRLLTYARMAFYQANERMGLTIRYGEVLATPPAKALRRARNRIGERLYSAEEINALVDGAESDLRAMIYMRINCGFP